MYDSLKYFYAWLKGLVFLSDENFLAYDGGLLTFIEAGAGEVVGAGLSARSGAREGIGDGFDKGPEISMWRFVRPSICPSVRP